MVTAMAEANTYLPDHAKLTPFDATAFLLDGDFRFLVMDFCR